MDLTASERPVAPSPAPVASRSSAYCTSCARERPLDVFLIQRRLRHKSLMQLQLYIGRGGRRRECIRRRRFPVAPQSPRTHSPAAGPFGGRDGQVASAPTGCRRRRDGVDGPCRSGQIRGECRPGFWDGILSGHIGRRRCEPHRAGCRLSESSRIAAGAAPQQMKASSSVPKHSSPPRPSRRATPTSGLRPTAGWVWSSTSGCWCSVRVALPMTPMRRPSR